jgi:hypothetical protein
MRLIDSMRTVLGVRTQRATPAPGPKPRLGARLVKDDIRITVQAGLTDSAWYWLIEHGWREDAFRNNRRRYREVPPSLVAELFDATDPDERAQLLQQAIAEAKFRPAVTLSRR